jgi:hypothetical protein
MSRLSSKSATTPVKKCISTGDRATLTKYREEQEYERRIRDGLDERDRKMIKSETRSDDMTEVERTIKTEDGIKTEEVIKIEGGVELEPMIKGEEMT